MPRPATERTRAPRQKPLAWLPFGPTDWQKLSAGMQAHEAGALMHLLMAALAAADEPCTIPGSDVELQLLSGLMAAWGMSKDRVLWGWERLPSGRLRNTWLYQRYLDQVAKTEKRSAAGQGGAAKRWRSHPARTQTELSLGDAAPAASQESAPPPAAPPPETGMALPSEVMEMPSPSMAMPCSPPAEVVEGVVPPKGVTTPPPASARAGASNAPRPTPAVGPPDPHQLRAAEQWIRARPGDRHELHARTHARFGELPDDQRATLGPTWTTQLAALRAVVLVALHAEYSAERHKRGPVHAAHGPAPAWRAGGAA
jgi:hypothetical protein